MTPPIEPQDFRPECTCLRLRKASRRVTQIYDRALHAHGMTVTQYGLLGHLRVLDGICLGDLADRLVMDPTTLTRTIKPLTRLGWIVSAPGDDDSRTRHLHITAKGIDAYMRARPAWSQAQKRIAEALGPEDSAALASKIDTLLDVLST